MQTLIHLVEERDLIQTRPGVIAEVVETHHSSRGIILVLGFSNGNVGEFQYKDGETVDVISPWH